MTGKHASPPRDSLVSVVIADDSDDLRSLLRMALELDGRCTVLAEAATGAEAIAAARQHQPEVILLDRSMPDGDVAGTLPRLAEAAPDTAVVILSGFSPAELGGRVDADAVDGYLVKGGSVREIQQAVLDAAQSRRSSRVGGSAP